MNRVSNYLGINGFKIVYINKILYIFNYINIIGVSNKCISIKGDFVVNIKGNNLKIIKMIDREIVICGNICDIYFGDL